MKKIVLLLVLAVMLCPAFNRTAKAEGDPLYTLSVSKSNGGILSLINLYGNVSYSETYDDLTNCINARLNCYGQGYTRCRVPADAGNYVPPTPERLPSGFATTVNGLLEQSENKVVQGVCRGSASKKVMATSRNSSSNNSRNDLYIYSTKWNCNSAGDGTVTIFVYKTDASVLGL